LKNPRQLRTTKTLADHPRRLCVHLDPPADTSALPPLGSDASEEAVANWLAHVDAGRIAIR